MKKGLNKIGKWAKKWRGVMLAAIGVGGFTWTCIDVAKQSFKARDAYKATGRTFSDLTLKEKLMIGVPLYWRPVVEGALSASMIIGGAVLDHREMVSLAGVAAFAAHKYKEYRDTNIEVNGKEADERVINKIANDKYPRGRITKGENEVLFYDSFSETWFVSTVLDFERARYHFNRNFHIALNGRELLEFYEFLGIRDYINFKSEKRYEDYMWDKELLEINWGLSNVDIDYTLTTTDDGEEYYLISFVAPPLNSEEREEEYEAAGYTVRNA